MKLKNIGLFIKKIFRRHSDEKIIGYLKGARGMTEEQATAALGMLSIETKCEADLDRILDLACYAYYGEDYCYTY